MNKHFLGAGCAGALMLVISASTSAALVDRGGGLIYDTDLNITWLANANANGLMNWDAAMTWAGNLSYGGFTDWRLPTAAPACGSSFNCISSEMGHLFYTELGGVAGTSIVTTHNSNYDLFQNFLSTWYWSGTEFAPTPAANAWAFSFGTGFQGAGVKTGSEGLHRALAVHSGDIGAVPIPAAVWLFGSGLLGLLGLARARRH